MTGIHVSRYAPGLKRKGIKMTLYNMHRLGFLVTPWTVTLLIEFVLFATIFQSFSLNSTNLYEIRNGTHSTFCKWAVCHNFL